MLILDCVVKLGYPKNLLSLFLRNNLKGLKHPSHSQITLKKGLCTLVLLALFRAISKKLNNKYDILSLKTQNAYALQAPKKSNLGLRMSLTFFCGGTPKERRRRRAEKRSSKRVFLESPFLLCPLKVFRTFQVS